MLHWKWENSSGSYKMQSLSLYINVFEYDWMILFSVCKNKKKNELYKFLITIRANEK